MEDNLPPGGRSGRSPSPWSGSWSASAGALVLCGAESRLEHVERPHLEPTGGPRPGEHRWLDGVMTSADVSARVAWSDDAPAIAAVQVRAWRTTYAELLPADVLAALDPEQIAAGWAQSLGRPADARNRVLVALERNLVTGFVVTGPATDPDCDPVADRRALRPDRRPAQARRRPRLPAPAGSGRHPRRRPVHPRGDLAASSRRRAALVPDRRRLGPRRCPPHARPARRRQHHGQAGPPALGAGRLGLAVPAGGHHPQHRPRRDRGRHRHRHLRGLLRCRLGEQRVWTCGRPAPCRCWCSPAPRSSPSSACSALVAPPPSLR